MQDAPPPIDRLSDADLVRRTADGDREAFATLYRRHHAIVYRFVRLMTGSSSAAEDIVQEVFLVLMRDARRYNPARAALPTYLYGVARHHIGRRLSRDRHLVALDDDVDASNKVAIDDDVAARLEQREALTCLRRAILSLPRRYREVVVLCELQDVSYHDASTALGCAVGTVRSRLHRAKRLLTEKMARVAARERSPEPLTMRCAV